MSILVRQSTAVELPVGPVLDADGVAVTDCVVGDFKIKKTTGNFAALNGSATLTHVSAGVYDLVLTTSDVDTVGDCTVAIDDTTNACQMLRMKVVEEAVYDALFAASANGVPDTLLGYIQLMLRSDAAIATDRATELGHINANEGSGAGSYDNEAAPTVVVGTGGITAASIATGAIDADAIAADAVTELQAGLATPADVNAQVLDVLNTDTFAEPTGVPAATNTLVSKISWLYMALRNKVTVTATKKTFFDDGDAAEWEKDVSDDGTTYTESEGNAI